MLQFFKKELIKMGLIIVFLLSFFGFFLYKANSSEYSDVYSKNLSSELINDLEIIFDKYEKKSFLFLNIKSLSTSIETVPWVKKIIIQRQWPNKIKIEVELKTPVAIYKTGEFIDEFGDFIGKKFFNKDLPKINTEENLILSSIKLLNLIETILANSLGTVTTINRDFEGGLVANFSTGIVIYFGTKEKEKTLLNINKLTNKLSADGNKQPMFVSIDARNDNEGFVVSWKN